MRARLGTATRVALTLLATTTGHALPALAQASATPLSQQRIDSVLASYVGHEAPVCAVGVTSAGATLTAVRGYADVAQRAPASATSRFGVGSVSKQFTAALIARLIDERRLALDAPVSRFVPEVGEIARGIAIENLLSHRSGLRDQWHLLWFSGRPMSAAISTADVIGILSRQTSLNFPPGSQYAYSNSNYTLLAIVAERVTGIEFAHAIDSMLFGPLAMSASSFLPRPDDVRAYDRGDNGDWVLNAPVSSPLGPTGAYVTITDMMRWLGAVRSTGGGVLSPRLRDPVIDGYGYGLKFDRRGSVRTIWHDGSDGGFSAWVAMYPDVKVDVAVLCASSNVDIAGLGRSLAGVASPAAVSRPLVTSETKLLSPSYARVIAGTYFDSVSTDARVFVIRNDSVFSGPWGNARLRAAGASTLVDDAARERFDFFATDSATVRVRVQDREGRERTYWKQPPPRRDRVDLLAIAGRYASRDLAATYTISARGDGLWVEPAGLSPARLTPSFADAYRWGVWRLIQIKRDQNGKPTGFDLSSVAARRLHFDKVSP